MSQPPAAAPPLPAVAGQPEGMDDPIWRLHNIYTIRNEEGKPEPFRPNEEQREIIEEIYLHGASVIVVVKARQLGVSTLLCLIALDTILFGTSVEACLIDFNSANAKKKLREKVLYAYDRLAPELRAQFIVYARSLQKGEFSVGPAAMAGQADDPAGGEGKPYSTYIAGETPRGGTFQLSHYSEWWETAARFPQRSADILTAGWPAGEQGVRVIESTVHGGKHGEVWAITKQGLDFNGEPLPRHLRTSKTPVVMFFPWWKKAAYREQGSEALVTEETHRYFAELARQLPAVSFDHEQMLWYQRQAETLGIFVKGQYPSTIHECWEAPVKGAIWAEALAKAQKSGRICDVPHRPDLEVDTTWDLGAQDNTRTLYWQHVGGERCLIDRDGELNLTLPDRIAHLKTKGYRFGSHYLPHDGSQRQKNGISFQAEFQAELARQGVGGRVVALPRTQDKWLGIIKFSAMLANEIRIDQRKCKGFTEAASLYRRKPDQSDPDKFTDDIVNNDYTHDCDCARYLAEAYLLGHLPNQSNGMLQNTYFASDRLAAATAALPERPAQRWAIDHQGSTARYLSARRDDQFGWLRVWQPPIIGNRYIVAVVNGAAGVWRAAGWDTARGLEVPAGLVAACVDEAGINRDRLMEWAALASAYYGHCPVAADVVSLPGVVERMKEHGAPLLARRQSEADRRLGQAEPIRKPGFELKKEERLECFGVFQECWRDGLAEVWCPTTLRQMGGIINGEDQTPTLLQGFSEHWVAMCALALWQIGQAAPMRPEASGPGVAMNRAGGYSGLQTERVRRKMG